MELPEYIKYRYQLTADVDSHLADIILSVDEKRYLESVNHGRRKTEFIAGRIIVRQLAGDVLACPPQDVPLMVKGDGSLALAETALSVFVSAYAHWGLCGRCNERRHWN